jgi:hypothetical protein
MHPVRVFRFVIAGLLFALAVGAAAQGIGIGAFVSMAGSVVALAVAVGVPVPGYIGVIFTRPWRDTEPWASPWLDVGLVVILGLDALGLAVS